MNRKPIFDAVRAMMPNGKLNQQQVDQLDKACDLAEAVLDPPHPAEPKPVAAAPTPAAPAASSHVLGALSEEFESSGRGPGTVSGGKNDPGGISYGVYQLSSVSGTCAAFVKNEGKPWATDFGTNKPGSDAFTTAWKTIATRDSDGFRKAQHAFIQRTHYQPVVAAVRDRKGVDLDTRADAVRDVTWSCAVQHAKAPNVLVDAIDAVDRDTDRSDPAYDRKLIDAIYDARIAYVLSVAANPKLKAGEKAQLISITQNRYPKERAKALAMYDSGAAAAAPAPLAAAPTPAPASAPAATSIDGRAVAAANGVAVKSAAVKISTLHPKMEAAIVAVAQAAKAHSLPQPVITSGNDSTHGTNSLHYSNRALDFRGNNIKISVGQMLRDDVQHRLGNEYDVLFETFMNPANNHLHVEYDPD
jgi:hypothetical protein